MKLDFRLLGPIEVVAGSARVDVGGPQQRAVLALLLLRANEVVLRDRLVDELWGERPPATARETVKAYIGRLRKALGQNGSREQLLSRGGGYVLQIEPEQLDLRRFQAFAADGSKALEGGDAEAAAALLRKALELWRGPPLGDLGGLPFARAEQARLEEMRLAALEERIEADLALGRASAVVAELRQLVREHPYREQLRRQLMLALYQSGRQAEALAAYQDARVILVELGIEPSRALQRVEKEILTQDPALERRRLDGKGTRPVPVRPPNASDAAEAALRSHAARGRRLVIGSAAIALAAAAIGAILLTRATPAVRVNPNTLAIIDPASNKLVADVAVGNAPADVVAANGRVWVANTEDETLVEVDPATRTVVRTVSLAAPPAGLAASSAALWVVTGGQTAGSQLKLVRVDPRFGAVTKSVPIATVSQAMQGRMPHEPLAFGAGTLWTPGRVPGTLVRRDVTTLDRLGSVELDGVPTAVAAAADAAWVTTSDNRLLRVDPATNSVVDDMRTGGRPLDLAVGADAVWIASSNDDVVVRYDPVARSEVSIAVGDGPAAVSFAFGSVWVACSGDGTVWRIDPTTRKVVAHWDLGASPESIAAGEGAVWAAVYSELPP